MPRLSECARQTWRFHALPVASVSMRIQEKLFTDAEMFEIRADPEIQRYEAFQREHPGEGFRTRNEEVITRYHRRLADIYEMIARDETMEAKDFETTAAQQLEHEERSRLAGTLFEELGEKAVEVAR